MGSNGGCWLQGGAPISEVLVFVAKAYCWIRSKRSLAFSCCVLFFDGSGSPNSFLPSVAAVWSSKAGFVASAGSSLATMPVVHWRVSKLGRPLTRFSAHLGGL